MTKKDDKIQIHPSIRKTTAYKLKMLNDKPSDVLENHVNDFETGNKGLAYKLKYLNKLKAFHEKEINEHQLELDKINEDIANIEKIKQEATIEQERAFKEAKEILDIKFEKIYNDATGDSPKFGLNKVKIKFVESLASDYHVAPGELIKDYKESYLKKVLDDYEKYF